MEGSSGYFQTSLTHCNPKPNQTKPNCIAKCIVASIIVSNTKSSTVKHLCDVNKVLDLNNFKKKNIYSLPCPVEVNTSVRKLKKK